MIQKRIIAGLFQEKNDIDVKPFIGCVVQLTCYPLSNPNTEETFIGSINYNNDFPILNVGFPWHENEKTSFARETSVSPNIDNPKAYYILKDIKTVTDETIEKWWAAGNKFCKNLLKGKEKNNN